MVEWMAEGEIIRGFIFCAAFLQRWYCIFFFGMRNYLLDGGTAKGVPRVLKISMTEHETDFMHLVFLCQHGFFVCGKLATFFLVPFSPGFAGLTGRVGGLRVKHCTAGIETKRFVYSNCDIFGEGDEG